jgi:hypothetical protein
MGKGLSMHHIAPSQFRMTQGYHEVLKFTSYFI